MPSVKRLTAIRLDPSLYDAVSERARSDCRSISNYIETILRKEVEGSAAAYTVDWSKVERELKEKADAPITDLEQEQIDFLNHRSIDTVTITDLRKNLARYAEAWGEEWPTG